MPEMPPGTLAEALAQLQGQLPRVAKTNQGQAGQGKYLYADLTDCTEALMPLLSKLGLSFTACPTMQGDRFVLHYALRHTSQDAIEGFYPLPTSGSPQQVGGAITYARRYTLCAVTGLAPGGDDDDAASAEQAHHAARQPEPRPGPQPVPRATQADVEDRPSSRLDSQHRVIERLLGQLGVAADNRTERHDYVSSLLGLSGDGTLVSFNDLSYTQAGEAIKLLQAELAKEKAHA